MRHSAPEWQGNFCESASIQMVPHGSFPSTPALLAPPSPLRFFAPPIMNARAGCMFGHRLGATSNKEMEHRTGSPISGERGSERIGCAMSSVTRFRNVCVDSCLLVSHVCASDPRPQPHVVPCGAGKVVAITAPKNATSQLAQQQQRLRHQICTIGRCSEAISHTRNTAMDDSIGGS